MTPGAIVNRVPGTLAKVAKSPDVAQKFAGDGMLLYGNTPAEFRQYIAAGSTRWARLVQDTGVKLSSD